MQHPLSMSRCANPPNPASLGEELDRVPKRGVEALLLDGLGRPVVGHGWQADNGSIAESTLTQMAILMRAPSQGRGSRLLPPCRRVYP